MSRNGLSKFKKVAVAMSGGVDSSVAAYLLKKLRFEVIGVHMQNWDGADETGYCSGQADVEDAEWACKKLGIKFHLVNFKKEYWNSVFTELLNDYATGFTPNPDILCNKNIKFDPLLKHVTQVLEADAMATGHYARSSFGDHLQHWQTDKNARLLEATDSVKDQTFFLGQIPQNALRLSMFPVGELTKSQVKEIAQENGLMKIAKKRESMGLCFVGPRNFPNFISQYLPPNKGVLIDIENGEIVGNHEGIHHWTVGQRCKISGQRKPHYIVKKDAGTQTIFVAAGTDHPALYADLLFTDKPHWIRDNMETEVFDCQFRFQNTHVLLGCKIVATGSGLMVKLDKCLRALTPGQFAVFYKDGECLGSARIRHVGPSLFVLGLEKEIWQRSIAEQKMKTKYHLGIC